MALLQQHLGEVYNYVSKIVGKWSMYISINEDRSREPCNWKQGVYSLAHDPVSVWTALMEPSSHENGILIAPWNRGIHLRIKSCFAPFIYRDADSS